MKGDEDMGTLSCDILEELTASDEIEFPTLTKEDIEDKSKSDALAKGLVILQTLWFIIQCIARHIQGLAITELEIVTLAFCSLNGAMYFFWWHKPLDVQRRVPVYLKSGSNYAHKYELKRAQVIEDPEIALRDIAEALGEEAESTLVKDEGQTDATRVAVSVLAKDERIICVLTVYFVCSQLLQCSDCSVFGVSSRQ